jgi:hypothetical protein
MLKRYDEVKSLIKKLNVAQINLNNLVNEKGNKEMIDYGQMVRNGKKYRLGLNGWEEIKDDSGIKVNSLPEDVDKVVIKGRKIVVILLNGQKGIVNCQYGDDFDVLFGFTLAYYKAKYGKCFDLRRVLNSCIDSAKRKGYEQAILKNHE